MSDPWRCVVCGLANDAARWPYDCATCRAARPGVAAREVPEDESHQPVSFVRVLVALLAMLTIGIVLAQEVRFLQRWGDGPVGHMDVGSHERRQDTLRVACASLLTYTAALRSGGDPDPEARELTAIRARARLGSGTAGPTALVEAEERLARSVQALASIRTTLAGGAAPAAVENELSAIERSIREAEALLVEVR